MNQIVVNQYGQLMIVNNAWNVLQPEKKEEDQGFELKVNQLLGDEVATNTSNAMSGADYNFDGIVTRNELDIATDNAIKNKDVSAAERLGLYQQINEWTAELEQEKQITQNQALMANHFNPFQEQFLLG